MKSKEAVVRLKRAGVSNRDIAELLGTSKQYVSRVCRASGLVGPRAKRPQRNGYVGVRVASLLLGHTPKTIRRWSDEGKLPSVCCDPGRVDRRFRLVDLWSAVVTNEKANTMRSTRRPT